MPVNLKLKVLLSTWDQAGIGCQMYLKDFLMILGKPEVIFIPLKTRPRIQSGI